MGKPSLKVLRIVKEFKRNIAKKYKIEKIILFGSQAVGKAKKNSDVDLIVVSKKFAGKKAFGGMVKLSMEWHSKSNNYPVDFLCYSPREFEEQSRRISIVKQALEEGVEI
jgi:predicted nucleotidyltransferase